MKIEELRRRVALRELDIQDLTNLTSAAFNALDSIDESMLGINEERDAGRLDAKTILSQWLEGSISDEQQEPPEPSTVDWDHIEEDED